MTAEVEPDGPADGEPLTDLHELLLRSCHPQYVDQGVPSADAFKPIKADRKRLSTLRRSMVTPAQACQARVDHGRKTAGAWAVSVGEAAAADVPAFHDGGLRGLPPAHASLYFGGKDKGEQETAAKLLVEAARSRGCLLRWNTGVVAS